MALDSSNPVGAELRRGDVCLLGDDDHSRRHQPGDEFAGAIHVYGGDFFTKPRSVWDEETFEERPFDLDAIMQSFTDSAPVGPIAVRVCYGALCTAPIGSR